MKYFILVLQLTLGCIVSALFAFCIVCIILYIVGSIWNLIEEIRWKIYEHKKKSRNKIEAAEARARKAEMEKIGYKIFFDDVSKKPNCNDCANIECQYRPRIGETVRFNCPLWRGKKEE